MVRCGERVPSLGFILPFGVENPTMGSHLGLVSRSFILQEVGLEMFSTRKSQQIV